VGRDRRSAVVRQWKVWDGERKRLIHVPGILGQGNGGLLGTQTKPRLTSLPSFPFGSFLFFGQTIKFQLTFLPPVMRSFSLPILLKFSKYIINREEECQIKSRIRSSISGFIYFWRKLWTTNTQHLISRSISMYFSGCRNKKKWKRRCWHPLFPAEERTRDFWIWSFVFHYPGSIRMRLGGQSGVLLFKSLEWLILWDHQAEAPTHSVGTRPPLRPSFSKSLSSICSKTEKRRGAQEFSPNNYPGSRSFPFPF